MVNEGSQNAKPMFSIVTVVYNGEAYLEPTIQSVVNQTYPNVEYIVIDGGSTDRTVEIIQKYADRITKWTSEKDRGIYDAMNKAIKISSGKWINFMNGGDQFLNERVLEQVALQAGNSDIIHGDALVEYEGFRSKFPVSPVSHIWKTTPFCHQASFVRTDIMKENPFDLKYRIGSDYDFFFKCYSRGMRFQRIDLEVCLFDGRSGATNSYIKTAYKEKEQIAMKYDYSISKWLYYKFLLLYVDINRLGKRMMGKKLETIVRRLLKK